MASSLTTIPLEDAFTPPTPHSPCSGNIWDDEAPPNAVLRDARWLNLSLAPATSAALALIDEVATLIIPHSERKRFGPKSRATFAGNLGAILGGLLREAFKGRPVIAYARPGGSMWAGAIVGHRAFWDRANAMQRAGLIGIKRGVQTNIWTQDDPSFGGLPTKLWPTRRLMDLVDRHGISAETVRDDWKVSRAAETKRIRVAPDGLIVCKPLDDRRSGQRGAIPEDQRAEADAMRAVVEDLNERAAAADIRGCRAPAFHRSFRFDLRLGGRFYAIGAGNFQSMSPAERKRITINGEPVTELDIHAAFLSIFLAMSGTKALPSGDLYALPGPFPRAAVKTWMVQSLTPGKLASRWADNTPEDVRRASARAIRDAAVRTYPALGDMRAILPPDLIAKLAEDRRGWAVGQYLANVESRIMEGALGYLRAENVLGLPIHDGIVVPQSGAAIARRGLTAAAFIVAGFTPRIKDD